MLPHAAPSPRVCQPPGAPHAHAQRLPHTGRNLVPGPGKRLLDGCGSMQEPATSALGHAAPAVHSTACQKTQDKNKPAPRPPCPPPSPLSSCSCTPAAPAWRLMTTACCPSGLSITSLCPLAGCTSARSATVLPAAGLQPWCSAIPRCTSWVHWHLRAPDTVADWELGVPSPPCLPCRCAQWSQSGCRPSSLAWRTLMSTG